MDLSSICHIMFLCMKYYIIYLEKTNFDCTIVQIIQIVHGLVGGEAEAEGHPVDQ